MSLARKFAHAIAVPLLLASAAQVSQAQPVNINFDDRAPYLGIGLAIEDDYMGLDWQVNGVIGMMSQSNTIYRDIVCRSGMNCGHNGSGMPAGISSFTPSTQITLSGWIRRWNLSGTTGSATSVLIESLSSGGTVVESQTFTLSETYQEFNFATLFTTLRFTPMSSGFFLIDDLVVNPAVAQPPVPGVIPEPSTYALMATGLIGLATIARRRRASQG